MRNFTVLLFVMCMTFLLSACSSKPDDVSQEVWDRGIQYTIYIDKLTQEGKSLPDGLGSELNDLITNDTERDLVVNIHTLSLNSTLVSFNKVLGTESEEVKTSYDEAYKKLEEVFGASNLKDSKLDENLVESYISENQEKIKEEKITATADFMKEVGVSLTGREVQFNLANNVDKEFYLEGKVELCDYYNYGYTNESSYFCGQLTPFDGGYSDSWYLYFHRESFESVYKLLLTQNVDLMVVAKIPSRSYKKGQGNMAIVQSTQGY